MKFVDRDEFYSPKEDSKFFEAIPFTNERFLVSENVNNIKENIEIKETANEEQISKNKSKKSNKNNDNTLKELTKNTTKITNNISHSISESSIIATGATSSIIVTAAAVIISIAGNGSLFTDTSKYVTKNVGNDYALINIDMHKILNEDEKLYGLKASDFSLRFKGENETKEIEIKEGNRKYLIPNLSINSTYSYELVCNKNLLGGESSFKKEEFITLKDSGPIGILDELNTGVIFDEESSLYTLSYQVFVSDYYDEIDSPTLYITNEKQDFVSEITSILHTNEFIEEDNFMNGTINNIKNANLYFYLVGYHNGEQVILMEENYKTNIDENYLPVDDRPLIIDENNIIEELYINRIDIFADILYIDETKEYFAYLSTYDENENEISSVIEASLEFDLENNKLYLSNLIDYDTKYYSYSIYYINEEDNMVFVLNSDKKEFSYDQSYQATYNKISPKDAYIEYSADSMIIEVDVNFTSPFDCFYYELIVVSNDGVVYSAYQGKENARFNLSPSIGISSINFIYNDYGEFYQEDKLYGSYNEQGFDLIYPTLSIDNDIVFEADYFMINYYCLMNFSYESARIEFVVDNGINSYTYLINEVKASSNLFLNQIEGEYGLVTIKATLYFIDNLTNNLEKSIEYNFGQFDLSYKFEITKITADIAVIQGVGTAPSTIGVTLYVDYVLPSNYKVHLYNDDSSIDINRNLKETIYFDNIPMDTLTNMNVSILDGSDNVYLDNMRFEIDSLNANNNYESPFLSSPGPADSVVTYNDDGTINLYRNTLFIQENYPNVYQNCMIYSSSSTDLETNETIYYYRYDSYVTNKYSIIENIPAIYYSLEYRIEYLYNDVYYIMSKELYSGGIDFDYESKINATCEYASMDSLNMIITIQNYNGLIFDNYIEIEGNEYVFDSFDSASEIQYTYSTSLLSEFPSEIGLKCTDFAVKYDEFSLDITMKGNKFYKLFIPIS